MKIIISTNFSYRAGYNCLSVECTHLETCRGFFIEDGLGYLIIKNDTTCTNGVLEGYVNVPVQVWKKVEGTHRLVDLCSSV